jgi:hypothetical protein
MNWFEQGSWEFSRFWRQGTEWLEYFAAQLFKDKDPVSERGGLPDWLTQLFLMLSWGVAIALGLLLLFLLGRLLLQWIEHWRGGTSLTQGRQTNLEPAGSVGHWLEQAQQLQASADYAGACRALYMALLIRLDEGGWLRQDLARTDREYLKRLDALWILAKKPLELRNAFQQIFVTHESIEFANRPTSIENFQLCQQAFQSLEPELNQPPDQGAQGVTSPN